MVRGLGFDLQLASPKIKCQQKASAYCGVTMILQFFRQILTAKIPFPPKTRNWRYRSLTLEIMEIALDHRVLQYRYLSKTRDNTKRSTGTSSELRTIWSDMSPHVIVSVLNENAYAVFYSDSAECNTLYTITR